MARTKLVDCYDRDGKKILVSLDDGVTFPIPSNTTWCLTLEIKTPTWRRLMASDPSVNVTSIHRTIKGEWIIAGKVAGRPGIFRFIAILDEGNDPLIDWGYSPIVSTFRDPRPIVNGIRKDMPTDAQMEVIRGIIQSGSCGLNLKELRAIRGDGRAIIDRLRRDPDWAGAIQKAEAKGGRYKMTHPK
jgi:hypothetical protein